MVFSIYNLLWIFLLFIFFLNYLQRYFSLVSEKIAFSIFFTLSFIQSEYHILFLLHIPYTAMALELSLIPLLVIYNYKNNFLGEYRRACQSVYSRNTILVWLFLPGLFYLILQMLLLPPNNYDSMKYHLARILLFRQENTLFLSKTTTPLIISALTGHDILYYMFLRFNTDYGVGIFAFLEYLGMGCALYALCRKFAAPASSQLAVIAALSSPLLVLQSISTSNDLMAAFVCLMAILSFSRLLHDLSLSNVFLLLFCYAIGFSIKQQFLAFALASILFAIIYLIRSGKAGLPGNLCRHHILLLMGLLPIFFLLSGTWIYIHNYRLWGNCWGPPDYVNAYQNHDGLWGAAANTVRYFIQSLHLLLLQEALIRKLTGISLQQSLEQIYNFLFNPLFGKAGAFQAFQLDWRPNELTSWYGPILPLLVYPSIIYAACRGPRMIKYLLLCMAGYAFVLCYSLPWMPFNGRFFTLCFCIASIPIAWLYDKSQWKKSLFTIVLLISILSFYATSFTNFEKPFLSRNAPSSRHGLWPSITNAWENNIFAATGWGSNRLYFSELYYGDNRVRIYKDTIPPNARVGILTKELDTWIYHYLIARKDVNIQPVPAWAIKDGKLNHKMIDGLDYLITIKTVCPADDRIIPLWQSKPGTMAGSLVIIKKTGK